MNRLSKINPYIWLGLIILLAAAARTYHITYPLNDMHSFRQTQTAGLIRDFYSHGINLFYPTMITLGDPGYVILEFPLYQGIVALLYKIFSPDVVFARSFSILCGLLSILFVYRLTVKFLDEKSALFAAFFYAFMPLNIFFQRAPMPDPLAILLSLVMLDFMIEGITSRKIYLLIGGIVACSLGLTIKSPYVAPLYLPLLYAVYSHQGKLKSLLNPRVFASFFIPVAFMLLWQWHANSVNEMYFNTMDYPFKELHDKVMVKLYPVNTWYFGTIDQRMTSKNYLTILGRVYVQMLSLSGLVTLILGFFAVAKRKAAFYFFWLFSAVLSIMVFFNLNVVHNYYHLNLTPVLAVFCGAGAAYFVGIFRRRIAAFIVTFALMILFIYMHYQTLGDFFKEENNYLEAGQFIDNKIDKNAMIATSLPKDDLWYPVIMYYANRRGFNLSHKELNGDMIEYLRDCGVKYLTLVDYMGKDNVINETLCPYRIISANNRVTIYDINNINTTCTNKLSPFEKPAIPVMVFNFENDIQGWHSSGGTHLALDKTKQYAGHTSLKITGVGQAGSWSFAQSGKIHLSPGKRYRLTGWMLIDSINSATSFFKCEIWKGEQWLKNYVSNEYKIRNKGLWRELKADFIAPEGKNISLSFAVEKRPFEKEVGAVIYIDEIKLGLIK